MITTYLQTNERQVKNNAGGLVYNVDNITRLERFLILGTVGGTYYAKERDLTKDNLDAMLAFRKGAARERENAAFAELMGGPANIEALTAFAEGREPDFSQLPPGW